MVSTSRKIIPALTGIFLLIFLLQPQVSADWCQLTTEELNESITAGDYRHWNMHASDVRARRLFNWSSVNQLIHVYVFNSSSGSEQYLEQAYENQTSGSFEFIIPVNATWSIEWVNPGPNIANVTGEYTIWLERDTCAQIPGFPLTAIFLGLLVGITIPLYARKRKNKP
ncbi:MAG: hypothetical protein ACFFAL_01305 [Promethearchaeota archaeon]